MDLIGNIYISGSILGSKGDADWVIASYSPDSIIRWINYLGTPSENDIVKGIFVDSLFNVYVCGDMIISGNSDIVVLKLDSAGQTIFNQPFSRTTTSADEAIAISVLNGNIFVVGNSQGSSELYDYTILKYNSVGILQWSQFYDGSGKKDDFSTGMVVKPNGDLYVSGCTMNNYNNFDFATIKISSIGSVLWIQIYGGYAGEDDFANAIDIDADGFIYVTGQSFVSSTNSDYTTIKYDNNGNQKWIAKYDGPGKGIDKAVAITAKSPGQIFISGSSEKISGNSDYATILYSSNGQMKWLQRYNGTANEPDEAKSIILDGNDIVVTGKSTNGLVFFDVVTLSYVNGNGNINWTARTDVKNDSASDVPYSLSIDQMGNVYVAGIANSSSSENSISLNKINQLNKNENNIELILQILAHGFLPVRNNSAAKQIMHDQIELVVDSFTQVRVQSFLAKCATNGLNIVPAMNDSISAFYSLNATYDWMGILLKRVYYQENKVFPMIYVENFHAFTATNFIGSSPEISYSYFEQDYPFPSVTTITGFLSKSKATSSVSWNLIAHPGPWLTRSPQILVCSPDFSSITASCRVCTPLSPLGGLPRVQSNGPQSHEIGISVGYDYHSTWLSGGAEQCMDLLNINPAYYGQITNYAVLRALPGLPFYDRITNGDGSYARIRKFNNPIQERFNNTFGVSMTLCHEHCLFHDIYEGGLDYGLGYGGVYEISKPGSNLRPVYFYFPYTRTLWFTDGPDMNIVYGTNYDNTNACPNGDPSIEEDYFIGPCQLCGQGQSVFGMTLAQEENVLATTDYQAIHNYWSDNAISIGFNIGPSSLCIGNTYTMFADNNSSNDCIPSNYPNLNSLIGQLNFVPSTDYSYEIRKDFFNSASFSAGTNFLIHVIAKYQNGETLNDCFSITLNPDPLSGIAPFVNIASEIRGNINDYDPNNPTNVIYQVDIYLLN
ncbi:MAG: SBBP repeat-containing protein [Bacteroidetes bacterium]|nr:SBBP repeat-containing protein [Bacteroidota bacterium]